MRFSALALLAVLFFLRAELLADDFKDLAKEYRASKSMVKGKPEDRKRRVESDVSPILEKIGALDTDESFKFLVRELEETDKAQPEIAAACVKPILASSHSNALSVLLKGLSVRNRTTVLATLEALAKSKKDISSGGNDLIRFAQTVQDGAIKKALPPALGKLDSVEAAKCMISLVQAPKGPKSEDTQRYSSAVVAALKGAKNDEIKTWLSGDAFQAAGSDPAKLVVVARLAGELKLVDAREELEKLAGHPSPEVSSAVTAALGKVGLGDSADSIVAALEKRKGKGDLAFRIQALDSLAKTGTEEALAVVLKYARGKDPEMQAVAMGSLGYFKDKPQAQEVLAQGLQDPNPNVRSATLLALAGIREKFMIEPLIGVLEKEKEAHLKVEAVKILVNLTHQNMGLVGEDWRKWWDVYGPKFEFPKEGEKGFTSVKVRDLSYFGIEVSSKSLGFLVDISSSMLEEVPVRTEEERKKDEEEEAKGTTTVAGSEKEGEGEASKKQGGGEGEKLKVKGGKARKIDILKKELCGVLRKLSADTQLNIVTFHGNFEPWQKQLQPLAGPGRAKAIQFVQGLRNGVGTNVFDTLEFALKDRRINTLYLLTDGVPTRGRIVDPQGILAEIQTQNRARGVRIHCIGFGEDSPFLKELAAQNGGEYRFVDRY